MFRNLLALLARLSALNLADVTDIIRAATSLMSVDWLIYEQAKVGLQAIADIADVVTEWTETEVDDQAVEALCKLLGNEELLRYFHVLLLSLIDEDDENILEEAIIPKIQSSELVCNSQISPTMWIMLVKLAWEAIRWLRDRR